MLIAPVYGTTPLAERFSVAAQAYDESRYEEALQIYQQLLNDGVRAPALHYNLGNTYYRVGEWGAAILHLQKAHLLAPRDPDIRHNLDFVLQEADALQVPVAWPARLLRRMTLPEWVIVATLAWWVTAVYLALMLWPGRKRGWGWAASSAAVVLVVALLGIAQWIGLRARPLVVVMQPGQEALFAPLDTSTAHFALPLGSMARVDSESGEWYRVRVGKNDGWIRQSAVALVAPWNTQKD